MIKIVDNFLNKKDFEYIRDIICSDEFPFYYNNYITKDTDPLSYYYFTHTFFRNNIPNSPFFDLWKNFLQKINCKSLLRIKASMYMNINKKRKNTSHKDFNFSHKGCLFYINTNNGETHFKDKKVLPKANRAVFFDPSESHSSSLCTDQNRRIVINFNYF